MLRILLLVCIGVISVQSWPSPGLRGFRNLENELRGRGGGPGRPGQKGPRPPPQGEGERRLDDRYIQRNIGDLFDKATKGKKGPGGPGPGGPRPGGPEDRYIRRNMLDSFDELRKPGAGRPKPKREMLEDLVDALDQLYPDSEFQFYSDLGEDEDQGDWPPHPNPQGDPKDGGQKSEPNGKDGQKDGPGPGKDGQKDGPGPGNDDHNDGPKPKGPKQDGQKSGSNGKNGPPPPKPKDDQGKEPPKPKPGPEALEKLENLGSALRSLYESELEMRNEEGGRKPGKGRRPGGRRPEGSQGQGPKNDGQPQSAPKDNLKRILSELLGN